MHANPPFFIFFVIILHTRFQFRNGFHHKIRDICMHNFRSIVNIFLNFLNSKFYMTIDVRTAILYDSDYMFVLPSPHVRRIWNMSLHDSNWRFVWSAMIGFYDPNYKILWPARLRQHVSLTRMTGFYDPNDMFVWPEPKRRVCMIPILTTSFYDLNDIFLWRGP
jgi:hypothetical protein